MRLIKNLFFILVLLFSETAFSKLNYSNTCQKEINIIEKQIDIPKGLLTAIGKTESGRFKNDKTVVIWPWTINTGKKSLFFDNKIQMKNFVINEIKKENYNLDVGCMQINLKWHRSKFKNILDVLDPMVNVSYATSFLYELHSNFGNWDEAIKRYHSSKPKKHLKYHQKVLAHWNSNIIKYKEVKVAKLDNLESHIKNFQPRLYDNIKKLCTFEIFLCNNLRIKLIINSKSEVVLIWMYIIL